VIAYNKLTAKSRGDESRGERESFQNRSDFGRVFESVSSSWVGISVLPCQPLPLNTVVLLVKVMSWRK